MNVHSPGAPEKLEDLLDALIDYRGKSPRKTTSGIPLITAKIIKGGEVLEAAEFIAREDYESWMRRGLPEKGDIIMTTEAPLGEIAQLKQSNIALAQRVVVLRGRPGILDNTYLKYYAQSNSFQDQLKSRATGTTVLGIKQKELRKIPVYLPSFSEQQEIGSHLKLLDDKIALNRQTARTLEELAQRLFKSWFVDFDPVRAKIAGRQPAHTPSEIANLFPDRLVDSPLGPIPEGWEIWRIEDIVTVKGGATPSTKEDAFWDGGTYHWATPKDLSGLQQKVLITTERRITSVGVEKISSGQLPVGTVLMSSRAPVGYLALADMPVSINQGFIAMICDQGVPNTFVLHWAEANMEVIKSNAGGSTFAEISKKQFRPLEVIVPPAPLLQAFDEMAVEWFQRVSQLARENVTLAQLRDRLLPALISGRTRIPWVGGEYSGTQM